MYSYDMWVPRVRVKANKKNMAVKLFRVKYMTGP
jgi:hypothetical protein